MITQRARAETRAYLVSDLIMTGAAMLVAYGIRSLVGSTVADAWLGPLHPFSRYLPLMAFILPAWAVVFSAVGLYGPRASRALRTEVARLVQAIAIGGLILASVIFALRLDFISRPVVLLFLLIDGPLIQLGRASVRAFVLDTSTRRQVLVAGDREEVRRTVEHLRAHEDWGLAIVGVVSDGTWTGTADREAHDPPVLGTLADIPAIVRQRVVDEVLVVPAKGRLDQLRGIEPIFLQLEELGIVFRLLLNFLPQSVSDMSLDTIGPISLLTFTTAPRDELLLVIRRVADIVLASALLVLLSPVMLIVALAVKLSSPGPVLFRQIRCGLNGRPFVFLKFRSMYVDAEHLKAGLQAQNEMDGPAFKMRRDPRVTPVGRFLRRTSLDELPQLWNILKGEMSFVGPRPAVEEEVEQYEPWQRRRLSMKPGLTCLWQISGRNELTFDEWMRLDLEYIDNWSLWLDLKIALKTIPAVLFGRGAR